VITVTTQLTWNGNRVRATIMQKLHNGVRNAVQSYTTALQTALNRWGSDPVFANYRVRRRHSSPGQAPFKQTANLHDSIQPDMSGVSNVIYFPGMIGGEEITGEISTDVDYAVALELGGSIQGGPKRHTSIRLINPIQGPINIAPRPAWIPTFNRKLNAMINHIRRG
jgi:hypothetical protein